MRKSSPWLRLAYCLGFTLLLFTSIHLFRAAETPPWRQTSPSSTEPASQPKPPNLHHRNVSSSSFRFLSYNLKNWLSSNQTGEKSAESKKAAIEILSSSHADVIGLSEIGSETDVGEIQKLLKHAGQNFPHFHHTGGVDPVRHLALLSRFPISSIQQPKIEIPGTNDAMQRGMIDVTLLIDQQPIRFIGLHLKSKRVVANFDEAQLRIREAEHVRSHIDSIFKKDPYAKLVVYGDFNDHSQSVSTRTILGSHQNPTYLTPIQLRDQRGERWTYYFANQDQYSRIDFITVSKSLKPHIVSNNSKIIDHPNWNIASDHRAILATFR
jgi:endonuclease/exonuclease/phosphatase family metal-dependent hydrolase